MKNILKESVLLFLSNVLARLFTYIYRIAVARILSVAEYGMFNLLLSFQFFAIILGSSAIAPTIAKFTAEYTAKKKDLQTLVISNLVIFLVFSFIIIIFLSFFVSTIVLASIIAIPFILVFSIFTGYLLGRKKIFKMSISILASQVLRIGISIFLILVISAEIFYAIFGSTLAYIIVALFAVFYFLRIFGIINLNNKVSCVNKINKVKIDFNEFKKVASFSSALLLVSVLNFSLAYLDIIVISLFRSDYELGLYSSASPLSRAFLSFFIALQAVMLPKFSEFHAKNNFAEIKKHIVYAYKISVYTLPLLLLAVALSEDVIEIFFGSKYVGASKAFEILLLGAYIFGFFSINSSLLQAANMQNRLVYAMSVATVINIVLNMLLVPKYGIEGAAFATTLSYISATVLSFIFLFQIFSR